MSSEKIFFSRVNDLLKPYKSNTTVNQRELDTYAKIKEYLDTLSLDKRKIAVGGDIFIWYFDTFGREDSIHRSTDGFRYGDNPQENIFMIKNPLKSLLTTPAISIAFAETVASRSQLTLVNNFQLNLLEQVILTQQEIEEWNYEVISRQQAEASEAGPFDFIAVNSYDIIHDPSLVLSYFNMLNDNGVMLVTWANDNGNLYETDAQYSPYFEINQHLKGLENVCVSHDYTSLGTTIVVKI
jgi:hypothetical protein